MPPEADQIYRATIAAAARAARLLCVGKRRRPNWKEQHVDEEVGINVDCRMDGGMYLALVFIACSAMPLLHCPMEIKARILDCSANLRLFG